MLIRLFVFALLISFSTLANAEYYLVYQAASSHVINLDFTPKAKKKPVAYSYRAKHNNKSIAAKHAVKTYTCGCTPESCYVPKRDLYTAASTDCVTYDTVLSGYR